MRRRDVITIAAGLACTPAATGRSEAESVRRRLIFHLDVSNPRSEALNDQAIWLYVPMFRTHAQDGGEVRVSAGKPLVERYEDGHAVLGLRWPSVAPYFTSRVAVDCTVWVRAPDQSPAAAVPTGWRLPERFIESDEPEIVRLAASLRRTTDLASARAIYEWVARNVSYAGFIAEDLGARYAVRERRGDCSEFAYLVAALARAMGLPARSVGGHVLDRDAVVRALEYHDWTEVFADGAWRLVDAQRGSWLEPAQHYIAFRQFSSAPATRLASAHRFHVDGEVVVSM